MSIPSIKLNPKDILSILEIIQKNGNPVLAREEIHKYLAAESLTGSISFRNAVYALAFHTLRILKLIEGRGQKLHLSIDGEILLRTYLNEGIESYHKELAKIVMSANQENVNVLELIQNLENEYFSKEDVEKQLTAKGIEVGGGKLAKWLRLLRYVRFVDKVDDKYKFNKYQLRAIDRDFSEISVEDFFNVLKNAYDVLTSKRRGNPYIPIPEMENFVCYRLIDKGFTTFDFRRYLRKFYNRKMGGYRVYFSRPGAREEHGLRIGANYYYYIAIFR